MLVGEYKEYHGGELEGESFGVSDDWRSHLAGTRASRANFAMIPGTRKDKSTFNASMNTQNNFGKMI
jgi:hypothetical protein